MYGAIDLADLPSEAERAGSALAASRSLAQGTLSDRAAQCSGDSASGLSTSVEANTHLALTSFDIAKCMHASFGQRENSMVQGLDSKQLYSHTAHDKYEEAKSARRSVVHIVAKQRRSSLNKC